ncbi:MAG: tRNA (guanosine(37)-N1)-methyltransferase TrmD [Rickettsiales bacterium]|jgi:tRNA (guanine37-N1)-methyltransferase|nr:tRNA (guanosine(37)-N1)-methyltransferase TrmD [Rickettsiales bacterium]
MFKVKIFTLFPNMFNYLDSSILGRALEKKLWEYKLVNFREYARDKYKSVDNVPFGGGNGMIIRPDVLADAIDANCSEKTKIYYMSPRGKVFKQEKCKEIIKHNEIAIICGRYEGLDQRVIDFYKMEELSIGDYVLTGGELPAMVIIDACVRNIEGVIQKGSLNNESFTNGENLEHDLYTHPIEWRGMVVPEVLRSGHHENIRQWKERESEKMTRKRKEEK